LRALPVCLKASPAGFTYRALHAKVSFGTTPGEAEFYTMAA